jgi:hypothetical protein
LIKQIYEKNNLNKKWKEEATTKLPTELPCRTSYYFAPVFVGV